MRCYEREGFRGRPGVLEVLLTSDNEADQSSGRRCYPIIHNALVSTSLGQFSISDPKAPRGSL